MYDLPAMLLIVSGTLLTIFQSNFDEVRYTADEIKTTLKSPQSMVFFACSALIYTITVILHYLLRKRLVHFEYDVERWLNANELEQTVVRSRDNSGFGSDMTISRGSYFTRDDTASQYTTTRSDVGD